MHIFENVNKDLILAVDYAFWSPASNACCLVGQLLELVDVFQQLWVEPSFLDKLFEELRIHNLRTAKIHHLIQYLVHQGEVFLDLGLIELSIEIRFAYMDELVKKLDSHCHVDVALGGGKKDEILVWYVDVGNPVQK